MATKKIVVRLTVEVEVYEGEVSPEAAAEMLERRLTALMFPAGMKVIATKSEITSLEVHGS